MIVSRLAVVWIAIGRLYEQQQKSTTIVNCIRKIHGCINVVRRHQFIFFEIYCAAVGWYDCNNNKWGRTERSCGCT
jgi:hypothetical protein